jgi:protein-tyrosine-phosphatase
MLRSHVRPKGYWHDRSAIQRPLSNTRNAARSIIAEAILNKIGTGKFRGYSAGSEPKGLVHPETLQLLASLGYDTTGFRSKSLAELLKEPQFDFVRTVCDDPASEAPPIWPGQPTTAHWGIADPAEVKGTPAQVSLAFKEAYRLLNQRTSIFAALPLRSPRSTEPPEQAPRDWRDGRRGNTAGTLLMPSPLS